MHELHDITEVEVVGAHSLRLVFEDGYERVVNLEPVLYGEMFGPLRDPSFFARVRLDPDFRTVVWPNDADFDPETLYNWDDYKDEFAESARRWATAKA